MCVPVNISIDYSDNDSNKLSKTNTLGTINNFSINGGDNDVR